MENEHIQQKDAKESLNLIFEGLKSLWQLVLPFLKDFWWFLITLCQLGLQWLWKIVLLVRDVLVLIWGRVVFIFKSIKKKKFTLSKRERKSDCVIKESIGKEGEVVIQEEKEPILTSSETRGIGEVLLTILRVIGYPILITAGILTITLGFFEKYIVFRRLYGHELWEWEYGFSNIVFLFCKIAFLFPFAFLMMARGWWAMRILKRLKSWDYSYNLWHIEKWVLFACTLLAIVYLVGMIVFPIDTLWCKRYIDSFNNYVNDASCLLFSDFVFFVIGWLYLLSVVFALVFEARLETFLIKSKEEYKSHLKIYSRYTKWSLVLSLVFWIVLIIILNSFIPLLYNQLEREAKVIAVEKLMEEGMSKDEANATIDKSGSAREYLRDRNWF